MKQRLVIYIRTFVMFTLLFILLMPIFMLYNHNLFQEFAFKDYLLVVYHGLPMNLSVAGYMTVIPSLILTASTLSGNKPIKIAQYCYYIIISLLIPLIYLVDMVLYGYWGFRLDTTPLFYFFTSPKDAIASVNIWFVIISLLIYLVSAFLLFMLCRLFLIRDIKPIADKKGRIKSCIVLLLCAAFLFLPIRGSITVSTMNLGNGYFSENQRLNHATVNPCFSLMSSAWGGMKIDGLYRFMKANEADKLFAQLRDTTQVGGGPTVRKLLNTSRPNIIVVVLESFSAKIMGTMGGIPVAVNMDRLGKEGILFTNFYANSFRTDRGLAAILAGYPAQPTTSIMKYPEKTGSLPMFPRVLLREGYDLKYYYGGDANFTDMRSFLVTAGFSKLISDKDFPASQRKSKWGAPDGILFQRVLQDFRKPVRTPFLKIIQTSSSHDPFDVPFRKLSNKILNAFAYSDQCLGDFVNHLKKTSYWKNTLIILVPDHLGCYPKYIDNFQFDRYHIPLILTGGAIKSPGKIDTYGSQIDIAATLLSQLGLSYKAFTFSKDMLNPNVPHFGYSTVPNAFCMVTPDDSVFYNCEVNKVIKDQGRHKGKNLPYGKALLQKLYDDLSKR